MRPAESGLFHERCPDRAGAAGGRRTVNRVNDEQSHEGLTKRGMNRWLGNFQNSKPRGLRRRARSDAVYQALLSEMPLHELRQARALPQVKLAQSLRVNQAAISKLEHRADMYISTLRDYIRAVGGDLEIIARFPGGTNF